MDALTPRSGSPLTEAASGSPLTEVTPGSEGGKKKKKKKKKSGRSVEIKEPVFTEASASATSTDKQRTSDIQSRHTALVNSSISKRGEMLDLHLLKKSLSCIQEFQKEKKLEKVEFEYNPAKGYSSESKVLLTAIADYKTMIDEHMRLFRNISISITADSRSGKNKAIFREVSLRNEQALKHANFLMTDYSNLCQARLMAYQSHFSDISTPRFSKESPDNYTIVISQTLELIQAYGELLSIRKELGEDEKDVLTKYNEANELLVRILAQAIPYYSIPGNSNNQEALIQLMSENKEYFVKWLQQADLSKLTCFNIQLMINSCILCGEMNEVQKLLEHFSKKIGKAEFIESDIFSLLINCKHSFNAFFKNKIFSEGINGASQAREIISALNAVIKKAVEAQNVPTDIQESLKQKLQEEFEQPLRKIISDYRAKLFNIENIEHDLIADQEKAAQKIQQKLEQRASERRKRREEAQKKHWLVQQNQTPEVPESTASIPPETKDQIHPSIKKALEAFNRNASLDEISNILSPLINSRKTNKFDRAQACYSYADMVKFRLSGQMRENYEYVCTIYEYGKAIREALPGNKTPPRHSPKAESLPQAEVIDCPEDGKGISASAAFPEPVRLPDFKMLGKFTKAMEALSTTQSMYASIENMTQAFNQAVDAISTEGHLHPEFLSALNQLKAEIYYLISPMNTIAECCADAQIIYAERGALLKAHKKGSKHGKKTVRKKPNLNQSTQSLKSVSDELNRYLTPLNKELASSKGLMKEKRADFPRAAALAGSPPKAQTAGALPQVPNIQSLDAYLDGLPASLKEELIKKLVTATPGGYKPEHWANYSLKELHPESTKKDHPLTLLAQGLNRQLRVKADGQLWLIRPGLHPVKAEGETLSKRVLILDFDFSAR